MSKSELLKIMMAEGALVIHAHPFREATYIDHIRLFPRCVQGVEVFNSARTEFENNMAEQYAANYGHLRFAGSDNHAAGRHRVFGGMATETPITSVQDFIDRVLSGDAKPFRKEGDQITLI